VSRSLTVTLATHAQQATSKASGCAFFLVRPLVPVLVLHVAHALAAGIPGGWRQIPGVFLVVARIGIKLLGLQLSRLLLKVAGRVDEFFAICGECQLLQPEVKRLVDELGNLVQFHEKEARKRYNRSLSDIVKHLQKTHKLVRKGQNLGIWMASGTGIGVAIGAALDNVGIGPGLGVGIGFAIGGYLDKKAEREGRVI